ncbi:MAG: helix-hairpin-helix domain-containing protein [Gaiellaceae bacterium]
MHHLSGLTVPKRRALALAIVGVVVLSVLWRQHAARPAAAPLRVAPIAPHRAPRAAAPAHPPLVVVDVAGAVKRPGLIRVPRGARVADAIARAGGLTSRAMRIAVNLAAPLADGEQVLVPARGSPVAAAGAASAAGGAAPVTGPISLSSASAEQLDSLPGVGPVTAQKIVAYRQQHGPFTSVEGLDAISGIGPSRIADLKGLVVP